MFIPSLLARGLSRVLKDARKHPILLNPGDRYVIFSDHHKGAETDADDFIPSKQAYLNALDHYLAENYHLVILGDAEELWEESIEDVVAKHRDVFEKEALFHTPGRRYSRIFGNHDSNWASKGQVEEHLHPFFPGLEVTEGLVFRYEETDPGRSGEIFLAHGHQGTLDSEFLAPISRVLVRGFWRTLQMLIKNTGTTPGNSAELRGEHDTLMYDWAREQDQLLLIAGHTHRPIWSSKTPVERKQMEIEGLAYVQEKFGCIPDYDLERQKLKDELEELLLEDINRAKLDSVKTRGCYFNDGCCSFRDGSVTAYELTGSQLKLARWERNAAGPQILRDDNLGNLFEALKVIG